MPEKRLEFAREKLNIIAASERFAAGEYRDHFYAFGRFGGYLHRIGEWVDEEALYLRLKSCVQNNQERLKPYSWLIHAIANVVINEGRWDEAIEAYRLGREIDGELGDLQGEAASLHGLANVLDNKGQWDEAIQTYRESRTLYTKIGDLQGEAASLASIANPLYQTGKIMEAMQSLRDAVVPLSQLGDFVSVGICLQNLAVQQANSGNRDEAIASAREAVRVTAQTQDENGKRRARELLAMLEVKGATG
jgi:tetratricopeptide (TPR) repeat protein